ncbi:potassium-transporting ATPase subunit KdpC [Paraburkholderia rhizosphaerae]|uniref:Potassium-transporting ATPase KdpC subunit n=1 Tax=Paraburkholderia rhizosphaerae TaxID=480658 RepID=A0A4R8LVP5_9BURK|nr:potassium-transporting ATPase subunit KdpC [Paraburkholderia rhizosphaerae]TDY50857.1 K+-transporting ATPase ATPase C chain [Paraburkholderia rhizosphaerae]
MSTISESHTQSVPLLHGVARPAFASAVFFMLVTGLAYPLATTGVAQLVMRSQANGSIVERGGVPIGSLLIGQNFTQPQYFHPRPSATTGPDPVHPDQTISQPYNAALSGASNLGPTSKSLIGQVSARAIAYRKENGLAPDAPVPVDAVTASASGLDPDISVANAMLQAVRVAHARGLSIDAMRTLIEQNTTRRQFGVLGDPRIGVLKLNLALDTAAAAATTRRQPASARGTP